MRAADDAGASVLGIGRTLGQQLTGQRLRRGALADPARTVEEIRVRRAPVGRARSLEHGTGVRVVLGAGERGHSNHRR